MVDIYLDASRLGIYPRLFTSPSGDSCILFLQKKHDLQKFIAVLTIYSRCFQEVRVQEFNATCDIENKGLLRMRELHLEFCDGKSWVRLLDQEAALNTRNRAGQYRIKYRKFEFGTLHCSF